MATVRAAAERVLRARPAGHAGALEGHVRFQSGEPVRIRLRLVASGKGTTRVLLETDAPPPIPYVGCAAQPVMRSVSRRALRYTAAALRAETTAMPAPTLPRRPTLAPPAAFGATEVGLLATLCVLVAVTTFGASLLSQNISYVGGSFSASNRTLGVALAVSRAGVLIAFVGTALADRRGRRGLLLGSFAGVAVANALAACSPNLVFFTIGQMLTRGFATTVATVAPLAAIEESPKEARAYSMAVLAVAGASGYFLGVLLLPLADLGPEAWRLSFALSAASLAVLPGLSRRLPESSRYAVLAARGAKRGRLSEVLGTSYGERFWLLMVASFLLATFTAPISQFTNRYLSAERGFSGLDITVFRVVTQGLPGLAGLMIGGRLADTRGRRPVAAVALFTGTIAEMAFLLSGGTALWISSAAGIVLAGAAAPALGAFSGELFPTEIRGTANALQLMASVLGSAFGLVAAGSLSGHWGLGPAIAVMGLPSLAAALVLIPRLPESAARPLDDVSPSEV